jgi:ferredoxin-NADP reductase
MTALQLLGIISTALLLQVAVGVGVILWRRGNPASQVPLHDASILRAESMGAWQGWRDFRVTRRTFEDAAMSQCSFYLRPADGAPLPGFKPGQYLTVSLPLGGLSEKGMPADAGAERRLIRCYSLSDQPDPAIYRITIKRALAPPDRQDLPPGVVSGYLHDHVQVDDVLMLKAPSGRFFIDTETETPVVLVAGGIGITPMLSMLRWCTALQPQRVVHLYYGVRNSADHAFKSMLESLVASCANFTLHVVYSNPDRDDTQGRDYQHVGYVDLDLLRGTLTHGRHQFYVCGPPPMMQSLVPALRGWGVREDDIHYEAFGPATVLPAVSPTNAPLAATAGALDIRLNRSGRTLVWDGQDGNLLDFVERQGVAVDSGCRSGSCGSCETRLTSGTVHYADKPDYDIAAGHCLLCVAKPQSALVLEL